ncbi:MAG: hypothetical protein M1813_003225 [Trichoglossum hirsutum]|nr:MAG: hypothetical protein M1813_003225 [Trichoglossum hirsutum]
MDARSSAKRLVDAENLRYSPLSASSSPGPSTPPPPSQSSTSNVQSPLSPSNPEAAMAAGVDHLARDFGYLLKPEIYHPLAQLEAPQPFHSPALQPAPDTPLETLLQGGHFPRAATLSAQLLTTSVSPTSHAEIFSLLYTRLSCLTLMNATPLAAQEVKALEDLSSSYYREPITNVHLVPWELRVLAVRLQGMGFGDWRRGVMGYYELMKEVREEASKAVGEPEKRLWRARGEELGLRVGNALIEMGDLEGAGRHLEALKEAFRRGDDDNDNDDEDDGPALIQNLALLHLRTGNISAAQSLLPHTTSPASPLPALISMSLGDYSTAADRWTALIDHHRSTSSPAASSSSLALPLQNLAICHLYTNNLPATRTILESLVDEGCAFHTLLWNLATVYELCSEKAVALKAGLAERVAKGLEKEGGGGGVGGERLNVDFKL